MTRLMAFGLFAVLILAVAMVLGVDHHLITLLLTLPLFGTIFVSYNYPVSGTTPPTAVQMNQPGGIATLITGIVSMIDSDTTGIITHNFGLSTVESGDLFPLVNIVPQVTESFTYPGITVNQTPGNVANSITVGKLAGTGTGFTAEFWMLRPHTLIR